MIDKSTSRGGGKGRPPGGGRGGFGKGGGRGRPPGGRPSSSRDRTGFSKGPRGERSNFENSEGRTAARGERRERPSFDQGARGERPAFAKGPGTERASLSRGPRSDRPERSAADRPATGRFRDGVRADARPRRERERPESRAENRPFRRREDRGRSDASRPAPAPRAREGERIAKVMARVGLCSRRDAEEWILAGRVSVNGEVLKSPARDVVTEDVVLVDGETMPMRERTRLFLYHKERGLVTTVRDPEGRPTVFESLPPDLPRVITIGRLDINTEGLLLLTNDGGLARILELPDTGWLRRYRVRCYGEIDQATLDTLRKGITVDGMHYGPIEATLDREKGDNVWLTLGLREGKNREVKRVLEHLGLQVNRLIRVSFGPFQLGDLPEGAVEEVRTSFLKDQLGPTLIEESGADFDAPVFVYEAEPEPVEIEEKPRRSRDRDAYAERAERTLEAPERRGRPDRARGKGPRPSRPAEPMRAGKSKSFGQDKKPDDARPARRHPTEPKRSIWRADDVEAGPSGPKISRSPRRGADPVAARRESGERTHERAGRVTSSSGRSVKVEKILAPRVRNDAPWEMERTNRENENSGARERKPRSDYSSDRNSDRRSDRASAPRSRDDSSRSSRPPREGKPFGDRKPREGKPFGDRKPSRDGKIPRGTARPSRDSAPSRSPRGGSGGGRPPRGGPKSRG